MNNSSYSMLVTTVEQALARAEDDGLCRRRRTSFEKRSDEGAAPGKATMNVVRGRRTVGGARSDINVVFVGDLSTLLQKLLFHGYVNDSPA